MNDTLVLPKEPLSSTMPPGGKPVKGTKYDSDKLRWSLLPFGAVKEVLRVLEYGAKKYGVGNWQGLENPRERYYNAAQRHLHSYFEDDEKVDPETGISHLAHACCSLLFMIWFDKKK